MMSSWAVGYRSSAVSTAASLKKAIRDERYEDLQKILKKAKEEKERKDTVRSNPMDRYGSQVDKDHPLWETNSRGWTPMHVAAIASPTIPLEWWRWILQEQSLSISSQAISSLDSFNNRSNLWTRQTDQGSTVVELFFRATLDPLPWCKRSVKEKAIRLRGAIERILKEYEQERDLYLRTTLNTRKTKDRRKTDRIEEEGKLEKLRELIIAEGGRNEKYGNITDDMCDVALVFQFWSKLEALFSTQQNECDLQYSIVNILARLRWCPELVGKLVLALFPLEVVGEINEAAYPLPLHSCVQSFEGDMPNGILEILCDADPGAASVPDPASNGRLPLHVALSRVPQHSWEESLCHLFAANPYALRVRDPVTGLPAFCLAADSLSPIQDHQIEQTAKNIGNRSLCWYYLTRVEKTRARNDAIAFLECRKLTTMYEVLRKDPSVLNENPTYS